MSSTIMIRFGVTRLAAGRRQWRRGFTLLEVLVAVTVLAVGVLGVLEVFSLSIRAAGRGAQLSEAVRIAQNELELAVAVRSDQMQPRTVTFGRFTCTLTYTEKAQGLVAATVLVQWTERGRPQAYRLSQLFLPRQ